jgi:hypothetical protein
MTEFSENLRDLRKHWNRIEKANREILKQPAKRRHTAKENMWLQCYRQLGNCPSQIFMWGNVYCTEQTPHCLKNLKKKTVSL